ncbi:hypothetical protein [Actinacidiphila sp. bgisy145]|uniref:hypothetical protein n=1 Tax=Actinacidiphila sp. bgisy145 TaxID=3413792 RepID=UPI003EB69938
MQTFTPPRPPAYRAARPREKSALLLSHVLAPANLVIALLPLIGWHSTRSWQGAAWGLLATVFCGAVPIGIVAMGVRRGALTDAHIRVRRQRLVPMGASLLSVVAGMALLHGAHAPRAVLALVVSMLVGLVLSLAVTAWWQISLHNSVAGGTVIVLALAFGPVVLAVAVVGAAAIGWSRLALRAHTVAQVVAGTALGAASGLVFALLR